MLSQIPCLNKCEITLAAFVWPFPGVCFQMSPQIACMNPRWLHLIFLHYDVFPNVSSLWEYFDLQGPWRKVLTDLKKSLYTLQADPEKSRDFMLKNPGILIDWKSRDPGIPGIPLGPDPHRVVTFSMAASQSSSHASVGGWPHLTGWMLLKNTNSSFCSTAEFSLTIIITVQLKILKRQT